MAEWSQERIERAFKLLAEAAVAGSRCPMTEPYGPLDTGAIDRLVSRGWIRSEVSGRNYRRAVILHGEHAGKATAPNPKGAPVWMIDGRRLRHDPGQRRAHRL